MKPCILLLLAQVSVVQQVEQLPTTESATALASKLLKDSRAGAESVVKVWVSGDPSTRRKARNVLNYMEEAALDPLLNLDTRLSGDDQAWRMSMVVETVHDLRRSAAVMVDQQLANRELVPPSSMVKGEEHQPPRRVCDEAYLRMLELEASNPESQSVLLRSRAFLQLPESRRDVEIRQARQSAVWRELRQ